MGIWDTIQPFAIGGFSGICATSVIQPLDNIKVRLQIAGEAGQGKSVNPFSMASTMHAEGGVKQFYKGLDSAWFRQATYATARLGTYRYLFENHKAKHGKNPSLLQKTGMSLFAGLLGSLVGNPADLALVRFQADMTLPLD